MDLVDLRPVVAKAIESGATQTAISSFSWDVAGDCENPQHVSHEGRHMRRPCSPYGVMKSGKLYQRANSTYIRRVAHDLSNAPMWLDMTVRCRKCEPCLAHRRRLWQARIITEIMASQRTWFGTLTLRPEEHYLSECRSPGDLSVLSEQQKTLALHKANGDLLTRYIKRVRASSKGQLRLCLVMEPHKSGLPHYHALVHEPNHGEVLKSTLQRHWPHGHSSWKLVSDQKRGSWYVAKYLSKTVGARVRASKNYGDIITALALDTLAEGVVKPKSPPPEDFEKLDQKERTD